jgi:hypothetical protein
MAGLDPATQLARGTRASKNSTDRPWPWRRYAFLDRADARSLGGRVKPGHDEEMMEIER